MDVPGVQGLGDGELLEGAVDAVLPDLLDLLGAVLAVRRDLAHARGLPDQVDVVLGHGVVDLVRPGQAEGRRLAPALGQEVVEEPRVPAHDPHAAAGALGVAADVGHAEDLRARQVRRQRRGIQAVPHVVEVGVPAGRLHLVLVLGRAEQQLVVDDGVVAALKQPVDASPPASGPCPGPGPAFDAARSPPRR